MAYKTAQTQDSEKSKQDKKRPFKNQTKIEFKVRRKKEYTYSYTPTPTPTPSFYQEDIIRPMPSFYPPMYPIVNEWTPLMPVQCPILPIPPIPIIFNVPPPSPIFKYYPPMPGPPLPPLPPGLSMPPFPLIPPITIPPPNMSASSSFNHSFETSFNTDLDTSVETSQDVEIRNLNASFNDPLETYLNLPKDLFPSARMLTLNPNAIIDEFCREMDMENHASWILDLEFGIPKCPITRPIPIYNVKLNSINCKNTPEAIHPGFESCRQNFKRILLFHYDCVISSWYRGYVLLNSDKSVDNFQSWLSAAMQELGMCWP